MEASEQDQQQLAPVGVATCGGHMAYATPYQTALVVASGDPAPPISSPSQPPATFPASQHQLAYHQSPQFHSQQKQLQVFWANQVQEIEQTTDFKNQSLPLARIKKIMKADEDVRMISAEAPVIFAKACEMFILELTLRSWIHTEENKRRTLQKNDIAAAISRTDVFDFLVDIIPRDELREEALGVTKASIPLGSVTDSLPYYYLPPHHQPLTGQQPHPGLPFPSWPHPQPQAKQLKQQVMHSHYSSA